MAKALDIFLIYQFLRRLVTPFNKWDAYKKGVIDKDGKVLIDKRDRTSDQAKSWGYYDRLLANLKKLLAKIPGGRTRIGSFAAALLLLKENNLDPDNVKYLHEGLEFYMQQTEWLIEDNVVGGGEIAGLGIGPEGDPPVRKRKKKKVARRKHLDESYWREEIW